MKHGEGVALTVELERRLRQSTDRLRDVRETLEDLSRAADALHHLIGLQQMQTQTQAAPPASRSESTATARTHKGQASMTPPPAKASRPAPSSAPSAHSGQEEIPEWRKLFPKLSAEVPGRGK